MRHAAAALLVTLTACQTAPIVPDDPAIDRVSTGYRFTEGPADDGAGGLYFTDIPNEQILRHDVKTGVTEVFRENSGGANGLTFDREGRLLICEGGSRRLTRLEAGGRLTVLAERWQGKRLNSPNDLVVDAKGGIYFTDPRYGPRDDMEMKVEGVYYLDPGGALHRVIDDLVRPNGINLSLDGRTLYVVDQGAKKIWAYDVTEDGTPKNGRVFTDAVGGDGTAIDERGNLYTSSGGMVWVIGPEGETLHKIQFPENPSNCTFGGPENRTLYVTARQSLYRVKLNVRGGR